MKYQSKKDTSIFATVDSYDEKTKTTILVYESGDKKGKSVNVSSSTLKRWWKQVEDDNPLNIDMEQVNKPYKPDVTPHYIPKPQSVIEYEENKKKARYNSELPELSQIVDTLGEYCVKINEGSKYVKFKDGKGTTLWRKSRCIDIYATEIVWEALTNKGFVSSPNKDKDRPFHIKINTSEEYDKVVEVIKNV